MSDPQKLIAQDPSLDPIPQYQLTESQRQFVESPHVQALTAWVESCTSSFPVDSLLGLVDQMFDKAIDDFSQSQQECPITPELRGEVSGKIRDFATSFTSIRFDPVKLVEAYIRRQNSSDPTPLDEYGRTAHDQFVEHIEFALMGAKASAEGQNPQEMFASFHSALVAHVARLDMMKAAHQAHQALPSSQ